MFVVTVTFEIHLPNAAAFFTAMQRQAANSLRLEPGCSLFHVCRGQTQAQCFLYEHYDSEDAFQAHLQSSHYLQFDQEVKPWIAKKSVATWTLAEAN